MKSSTIIVCGLALAAAVLISILSTGSSPAPNVIKAAPPGAVPNAAVEQPPEIPATPAAVDGLVYARKFTLQQGAEHLWRKEKPVISSAYLLVLKVNPELVFPRQTAEPVLYVGRQTAERLNIGYESGHVVAIVPADVDLKEAPIWFGTPELPERVDAETIDAEFALAIAAGITPFTEAQIDAAFARGGAESQIADKRTLLANAGRQIEQYSPTEKTLANAFLHPGQDPQSAD